MSILGQLNPQPLWTYFEEICNIPRLSKNEGKIRKYLLDFAEKNGLVSKEDETGNILIVKPATEGMENRKTIVLQSHMDMVGEKNPGSKHNWSTDPVIPVIEGGWVAAKETTLGADDGIGVASQLAILTDKKLKAGKIECLFTIDEESGMTGAINLKSDFFTAKTLINLDSEDEGILFIGCAGGLETVGKINFKTVPAYNKKAAFEITVSGLHGGHSGDEIHKGYGNSIKIMTRILMKISEVYDISVFAFDGGNLRNAIPREAISKIVFDQADSDGIKSTVTEIHDSIIAEYIDTEEDIKIIIKGTEPVSDVMNRDDQEKFFNVLSCCPHGALAWSKEMDDLVETSTNLASVKFKGNNIIKIVTTQRSSIESSKLEAAARVESCLKIADAEVIKSNSYPGWKPDLSSEILKLTRNSYLRLFAKEPLIRVIHAGLECGLIYEKIKGIDMISFGPTIRGAHTTEEKIEIKTAQMFWNLLQDVVSNMPVEQS
jgi:dipeptidase D